MNGLIKSAKLERSNPTTPLQSQPGRASAVSDAPGLPVQLDRLAEEVVESVLAGYGYMHMADSASGTSSDSGISNHRGNWQLAKGDGSPTDNAPGQQHSSDPEAVQLFLDIEPAESWSFLMHPGAFRRIVMNLFGNSLKFTRAGFIRVHLRQQSSDVPGVGKVLLTVSDSGKGISEEYLRNQLFTPFAQEDHFAPGTGLGLSLVRQVVTGLGGEIDVASKVGCGTTVRVSLPLPSGGGRADEEEASFGAVVEELAGLRVLLRGSGQAATTKETHISIGSGEQDGRTRSQLELIESICQGWLKMRIVSETDPPSSPPDFIISTNETFSDLETGDGSDQAACPHIFVCRSSRVVTSITNQRRMPDFFEVLSQPLGPRKLAKSLYDSRLRWKEGQRTLPKSGSMASLGAERPLLASTPSQAAELTAVLQVAGIIDESTSLSPSAVPHDPQELSATESATDLAGDQLVPENVGSVTVVPPSVLADSAPRHRRTVLIVDDNPINRKVQFLSSPRSAWTNNNRSWARI